MQKIEQTDSYLRLEQRFKNLQQKEKHLQIINDFALNLIHQNSEEEIVWLVAKKVVARMGFVDCVVYIIDKEKKLLFQRAAFGPKNPAGFDILNPITIPIGKGIVGSVALSGKYELINNTQLDDRYILDDDVRLSEIAVPIIFENEVIGVIDSEHPKLNAFDEDDVATLMTIAAMISSKIVHARALKAIKSHQIDLEIAVENKTKELTKTIARLEKSNQDLERFAYAASHDLQEPLRTVVSYLQLFERKENNISEDSRTFLNFAIDGSKRMKKLLDGLLAYSRLKSTSQDFEIVDLNDTLLIVKANLSAAIQRSQAKITHTKLPTVLGDKTQLNQLFQNLISNALKFVAEGEIPIIELSSKVEDGMNWLVVKDNGLGIDEAYHDKIFGLFNRLHSISSFEGSGIGLALCKRIVECHNGSISLKSKLNEGTSFIFSLPINKQK